MRLYGAILLAALVSLTGVLFGLWWAPFLVALPLPLVTRRGRATLPVGAGIGLFSWAVPLAVAQFRYELGPTAQSLAAIMGFGHAGAVPVVLTLLVGTLLGLTGAWVATSAWTVVAPHASVDDFTRE